MSEPQPITAGHVAVAIVAACGVTGVQPERVFEVRNARSRVLAAAACVSRFGWGRSATARAFHIPASRLSPSGLTLARVTTDDLLTVAEALRAAGLAAARPQPPAAEAPPSRKAEPVAQGVEPERPASPEPEPPVRAEREPEPEPRRTRAARPPVRTNPVRRASSAGRVTALKPVNDRIVGWASQQVTRGADLDFVAECFGVDPDALREALEPMGIAA